MKMKQFKRTNLVNNNIYQLTLPDLNMFQREKRLLNIVTPYQIYEMERDKSFRNIRPKPKGVFQFNVNIHHYNSNPYLLNSKTEDIHKVKRRSVIQKDIRIKKNKNKKKVIGNEKKTILSNRNFLQLDIQKCTFRIKKSFYNNNRNQTSYMSSSVQTDYGSFPRIHK